MIGGGTIIRPMHGHKLTLADYFGFAMAGCSAIVAVIVVIMWGRSYAGVDSAHLPGPGIASIDAISEDGRLMIGVFSEDNGPRGWRPRFRARLSDLQNDDRLYFTGDFWGWGFAVPHLVVIGAAAVPVAWWAMSFRERKERRRRAALGLCRHCGYDIRYSLERCPECGNRVASRPELATPAALAVPPMEQSTT